MPVLLQIDSCLGVLSTGRITEGIASVATKNGWECYIAHGARYVGKSIMKSYQVTSKSGEYLHYAKSILFDSHGLGSTLATKKLIRLIDVDIKPDIIHLHCIHGYYLNYKVLFEYLNKKCIPVVWTFHDCWAFTGHCAHFVTANCNKWKSACYECPLKSEYPKSITDASGRNYDLKKSLFQNNKNLHIVTVSEWLASLVSESFLGQKEISVIRNGIDINQFTPKEKSSSERFNIIGVASAWGRDKGLYDFYKLRELLSEDKYSITLVGLTQDQINSLPQGIRGICRTNSVDELAKLYSDSDVFVNPTYVDSFPTVNMEAMACGLPVITYNTGGGPEAITSSTGIVLEQGDINGIADAVRRIQGGLFSISECRQRAEECFDNKRCYLDYVKLYNRLLENR